MRVFISDANILIDIVKLELENAFFDLPDSKFYTTDFVYNEISDGQKLYLDPFFSYQKLIVLNSDGNDLSKIIGLLNQTKGLSLPDCSIWHHTEKHQGILLTGDAKLRKTTQKANIEVRGILFIFDEFLRCELIDFSIAIEKLNELTNLNNRLPKKEIKLRFTYWKNGECL